MKRTCCRRRAGWAARTARTARTAMRRAATPETDEATDEGRTDPQRGRPSAEDPIPLLGSQQRRGGGGDGDGGSSGVRERHGQRWPGQQGKADDGSAADSSAAVCHGGVVLSRVGSRRKARGPDEASTHRAPAGKKRRKVLRCCRTPDPLALGQPRKPQAVAGTSAATTVSHCWLWCAAARAGAACWWVAVADG